MKIILKYYCLSFNFCSIIKSLIQQIFLDLVKIKYQNFYTIIASIYSFSSLLITGKYFAFLLPADIDIAIAIDSAISSIDAQLLQPFYNDIQDMGDNRQLLNLIQQ